MRVGRIGFALGYTAILAALYWHDSLSTNIFGHVSHEQRLSTSFFSALWLRGSWSPFGAMISTRRYGTTSGRGRPHLSGKSGRSASFF
jgi:hypothetical protein